ncbi:hypothetical protein [Egbenema bharatensis]|uniref:hypothetical protein n=1 Tax=Egbenema bharatensis TaxID=3463334 RepID=UPI003A8419A0
MKLRYVFTPFEALVSGNQIYLFYLSRRGFTKVRSPIAFQRQFLSRLESGV